MQSILTILPLLLAETAVGFVLPKPIGKYSVTLTTGPLADYKRNDIYAPKPTPRTLMLSVFQPAKCASTVDIPYMPNKTAEYQGPFLEKAYNISADLSPVFLEARLPVCGDKQKSCLDEEDFPILLFSPGSTAPRLYYSSLASDIASEGFIVITIDHPEDANIITYPDGHVVYRNDSVQLDTDIRVADASFLIDQLSNATAMGHLLPHRGARPFPTNRIAMLGHSLGGETAVQAAAQDSRVRGAINWDGSFLDDYANFATSRPVLLMSHGGADYSFDQVWPKFTGPKLWVNVENTTHLSFTDGPSLLQGAGLENAAFGDFVGTIEPAEMVKILVAYTTAWMKGVFKGKIGGPLLEGWEPCRFPEASTLRKENF